MAEQLAAGALCDAIDVAGTASAKFDGNVRRVSVAERLESAVELDLSEASLRVNRGELRVLASVMPAQRSGKDR